MAQRLINRNGIINIKATRNSRGNNFAFKSITASLCSVSIILMSNFPLLGASENPIIEVTANICENTETNMILKWNGNAEIYSALLPQKLGNEMIESQNEAVGILQLENDLNIRNKLRSELLALKFNIAHFEIGDNIPIDDIKKSPTEIADQADALLALDPPPLFTELDDMRINIEKANSFIKFHICEKDDSGFASLSGFSEFSTKIFINKIGFGLKVKQSEIDHSYDWVELYNPAPEDVNIKNWQICNNKTCDILSKTDNFVSGFGYAVIAENGFNIEDWDFPDNAIIIILDDKLCDGMENNTDMLELKDNSGFVVDSLNWGRPDNNWTNYRDDLWNPGIPIDTEAKILKRIYNGFDTDTISDWIYSKKPEVDLITPDTDDALWVGRTNIIKWDVTNNENASSDLRINIWYSNDNGNSWANIITGGENTGIYEWRMPLYIDGYFTISPEAKIKIVAIDKNNFMIQGFMISENTFTPSVNFENLTSNETLQAIEIGLINETDIIKPIVNDNFVSDEKNAIPSEQSSDDANASTYINIDPQ